MFVVSMIMSWSYVVSKWLAYLLSGGVIVLDYMPRNYFYYNAFIQIGNLM